MAIREGAWDCTTCGRTRNRGPEKYCAGCGHPRGRDIEIYLPDDAAEVTEKAALERALAGADWCCDHCGGDNQADADYCTGCGAPGEGASTREVVVRRDEPPLPPPPPAPPRAVSGSSRRPSKSRRKELKRAYRRKASRSRRPLLIGCLGLLAVVVLLWYLGRTSETTATVASFGWERTIEIEKLLTVTEEAKPGEVPDGARLFAADGSGETTLTVSERIQVGTEKVKVGVRDLGNGYFEDVYEERPVYETRRREVPVRGPPGAKVRYQIDRWTPVREKKASGRDQAPRWPALSLETRERPGKRSETYIVFFTAADGDTLTYRTTSEEEWRRFRPGDRFTVEATKTGRVRSLRLR